MMTSIAGGLNTGIWLCAVVLGATGSAIIVTVAASLLCAGVKYIVKHFTLSPKSHPKEVAPAPMKRRTIATQTTQTKEITYA